MNAAMGAQLQQQHQQLQFLQNQNQQFGTNAQVQKTFEGQQSELGGKDVFVQQQIASAQQQRLENVDQAKAPQVGMPNVPNVQMTHQATEPNAQDTNKQDSNLKAV